MVQQARSGLRRGAIALVAASWLVASCDGSQLPGRSSLRLGPQPALQSLQQGRSARVSVPYRHMVSCSVNSKGAFDEGTAARCDSDLRVM